MNHHITRFPPHRGPLPIPHCFQFPSEFTEERIYGLIVPHDLEVTSGDGIYFTLLGNPDVIIKEVVDRRPAKGDWSKQAVHKNPHYVRFIAK